MLVSVYVPPQANMSEAERRLAELITGLELEHTDSGYYVPSEPPDQDDQGQFLPSSANTCSLEQMLHYLHHYCRYVYLCLFCFLDYLF